MTARLRKLSAALAICALGAAAEGARAQGLEPRAYSPGPTGVNFVVAGYAQTRGGLAFDDAVPIKDPELSTGGPILAYARTLAILGRSGKIDVILPTARLSGSAIFRGEPVEREVTGMLDPLMRISMLFYGAPAMDARAFRAYRQDLVMGVSLQVSAPLGQYDASRLINLGANRWTLKPEIGVSKTHGPWTVELQAAATLFGDNPSFFGSGRRAQQPLYSGQLHAVYSFRSGLWGSLDAIYYTGGRTTLNGVLENNLQQNWRVGATLAVPVDRRNSVKLYVSSGVSARTGNNFDLAGVAWQRRWGAGL